MIDEEPTRRTPVCQSRAPSHEEIPLVNAEKLGLATSGTLYGMPDTFEEAGVRTQFQVMDMSNQSTSSYSFNEPAQRSSIDFSASGSLVSLCTDRPLTFGPVSLLNTSSKLAQPPNLDPPSQYTQPSARVSTYLLSDTGTLLVSGCLTSHAQSQDEATTHEDEGSERVTNVIHPELALDKTAESNALPFVIQAYGAWIGRLALDPLKLRGIARDFVFSRFRDGDESRWIIGLLANIGSRVGRVELVESRPTRMISMLQSAVRRRLGAIKSCPNPKRSALANALEFATQAMLVHFYVGPVSEAISLVHEAAPVFRQLCPERSNAPIDLPSLLQHPLTCLRYYAHIDILMSAVSDKPTLFRYEAQFRATVSSNGYAEPQMR
ncbi:unnamed protein product [Rhizoctonia solani]|uniref:Uncharacterized protein n=1 Tax=Rhizoctonia solani TaxID=456999 RepID=A0A8H2WXC8_9AGAM|nr:unnamed protein product [Rhizoctonia solani]